MDVYERVVTLCKQRGIAQTALEKELGFGRGSIGKMKTNKPSVDRLQAIADYFNVPITYFTEAVENSEHLASYYIDAETAALAQKLLTDPNYRILFDAAQDSRPEDMQMVADLLRRFKEERR